LTPCSRTASIKTESGRSSLTRPFQTTGGVHNRVKEILRTNDAVLLSWARTVLADAGIDAVVLDTHTSILEGSIAAIQQRLVVSDGDHAAAVRHLDAARDGLRDADPHASTETTQDALLGGRVSFRQPAHGYRAAIDPVLLAAALPAAFRGRVADLGCGAGAAGLCLAARLAQVAVVGIERDPLLADLARQNVADNAFASRIEIVEADIRRLPPALGGFDAAIANPPYLEAARANAVVDPRKSAATVETGADLEAWIDAALRLVRDKGTVAIIHRADRLDDLLAGLRGRAGEVVVVPLWPKADVAAKRVIVRARKGIRSPLALTRGLVLHEADGGYTAAAEAVLRGAAALDL
jgi:tRNA1(Val) A37 N6-methylase TrmN6